MKSAYNRIEYSHFLFHCHESTVFSGRGVCFVDLGTNECGLQDSEFNNLKILGVIFVTEDPQFFPAHTSECFVDSINVCIVVVCSSEGLRIATLRGVTGVGVIRSMAKPSNALTKVGDDCRSSNSNLCYITWHVSESEV